VPPVATSVLRKQIASSTTGPLYALVGGDDMEKSAVAAEFAEMVDEGLRAFNVERMYGGEISVSDLADAANTLPMMAPRRVVIVLEAEKLFIPKRESKAAEEEQQRLEKFLQAPPESTTIVFVCGALDMRRRVVKQLVSQAQIVKCGVIENEADAESWVKVRAARDGITLDPATPRALVARTGLDVVRLRAGLERVSLYAMGQPAVTPEDVRLAVSAGPEAHTDFGIANAIQRNDVREALREVGRSLEAGMVPFFILGQLRLAAQRLPRRRIKSAVEAVFRTDIALKSSGGDPRILIERLVVEMCEEQAGTKKPARRV
jgi:DNA polymerase III subunit delta